MQPILGPIAYVLSVLAFTFIPPTFALSQTTEDAAPIPVAELGQWLPNGAYGVSRLNHDPTRRSTYLGAEKEADRLASFLPSMALLYNIEDVTLYGREYVEGVTHNGVPLAVLKSSLSGLLFEEQEDKDVVTHAQFDACLELDLEAGECISEVSVGGGHAYSMQDAELAGWVMLSNQGDRRIFYLRRVGLEDLEKTGHLTIHKDRRNPRWKIFNGYASKLSATCGKINKVNTLITEDKNNGYASDPSTWGPASSNWDLKALEIMNLGTVTAPNREKNEKYYSGIVEPYEIGNSERAESTAIDITVFAYRDTHWSDGFYKFGGLAQVVECTTPNSGAGHPKFATTVDLYFDLTQGEVAQEALYQSHYIKRPLFAQRSRRAV